MKVVVCDRCERILQHKRKKIWERFDSVSISPQERLDLCETCYPFWDQLHRKLVESAERSIEQMEREEKQMVQQFWDEGVKNGIGQEEGNRPPTWRP